jgi:hypothetical protein
MPNCPYDCDTPNCPYGDDAHDHPEPIRMVVKPEGDDWSDLDWVEKGLVLLMAVGFGAVVAAIAVGLSLLARLVF